MKTPREILLDRHRAAETRLDAIRRAVVSDLNDEATKEQSLDRSFVAAFLRCSKTFWRELILPSRRIWAGLAAVWMAIFAINAAQRDASPVVNVSAAPVMMSIGEQQRMLNELFADRSLPSDVDRPKLFSPKPRTELSMTVAV
jgi:hypothetical protein